MTLQPSRVDNPNHRRQEQPHRQLLQIRGQDMLFAVDPTIGHRTTRQLESDIIVLSILRPLPRPEPDHGVVVIEHMFGSYIQRPTRNKGAVGEFEEIPGMQWCLLPHRTNPP
jgi:hypothetical protein